mgnify:FL=1
MFKSTSLILISFLLLIPNISYSKNYKRNFIAWGTNLDFIIVTTLDHEKVNKIIIETQKIVTNMNLVFNNYDQKSEISAFNELDKNKELVISKHFFYLINKSIESNQMTNGYFDITIGKVSREISFNKNERKSLSKQGLEDSLNNCSGINKLILNSKKSSIKKRVGCLQIDLGGIAEGYALKLMLNNLKSHGIKDALINFGGNISTMSSAEDWNVSLRAPEDKFSNFLEFRLNNLSLSTSSQYSKKIKIGDELFSHIIDPKQNQLKDYANISISVIHSDPVFADMMSTALISMPLNVAIKEMKNSTKFKSIVLIKDSSGKTKEIFNNFN